MLTAAPPPALGPVLALAGAALAALAGTGYGLDGPGRALVAVGATVVLGAAALAAAARPTLHGDACGVRIRLGWRHYQLAWADIEQVRADPRRRSRGLEIDLGDTLIVLPAFLLGRRPPAELAAELEALRPSGNG